MTKTQIQSLMTSLQELHPRIESVCRNVAAIQGRNPGEYTYYHFHWDESCVVAEFTYNNCGYHEEYNIFIPVEYLWMEDYQQVEANRIANEYLQRQLKAEQAQKEINEAVERQELEEYERLRQKFEAKR